MTSAPALVGKRVEFEWCVALGLLHLLAFVCPGVEDHDVTEARVAFAGPASKDRHFMLINWSHRWLVARLQGRNWHPNQLPVLHLLVVLNA